MPRGIYFHTSEQMKKITQNPIRNRKIGLSSKGKPKPWVAEINRKRCLGKSLTKNHKKKLSKIAIKKGYGKWMKGKHHTEATKQKIRSVVLRGEKHPWWQGGISNNPYPSEFSPSLKRKIRERNNFICCLCGRTEREELEELNRVLCVNHIDFDKNNCQEENLNTLCVRCNTKICRDREYWTNYFLEAPKIKTSGQQFAPTSL